MLIPLTPRRIDPVSSVLALTLGQVKLKLRHGSVASLVHRSKSFELPVPLWHYVMSTTRQTDIHFQYVSPALDPWKQAFLEALDPLALKYDSFPERSEPEFRVVRTNWPRIPVSLDNSDVLNENTGCIEWSESQFWIVWMTWGETSAKCEP